MLFVRLAVFLALLAASSVSAQTPAPFFSLTFATEPAAATAGTASYGWQPSDASDAACGIAQYHQGLITLEGGQGYTTADVPPTLPPYAEPQFLNLSAATGPYSVDSVLPVIFGPSTAGGWSVEVTFKPTLQGQFSKLIDIGSTRTSGSCNNDFYLGWTQDTQTMSTGSCDSTGASNGNNDFGGTWVPGQWYHVVFVIAQLGNGSTLGNGQGNWTMYVNGVQSVTLTNTFYPVAAVRQNAMIGNSNWGDQLWAGWLDTFNVYDAALTATQAANLSSVALGSSTPTLACTATSTATTVPTSAMYYSNTFDTNPITALGLTSPTYQWTSADPLDSSNAALLHSGLILLNGTSNAGGYANMTATSGPSAVASYPLGPVGGQGTGSISDGTLGWSFEVVYKAFAINSYAKIYDLTNGAGGGGIDDIIYGYNGGSGDFEVDYDPAAATNQQILSPAGPSAATLQLNTWYHHVWVIQYNSSLSFATAGNTSSTQDLSQYYSYLNGSQFSSMSKAIYPPYMSRNNGFLGRSAWGGDPAFQGYVDLFRVYSVALTPGQVQTLYQQAMVTGVPASAPGSSSSSSAAAPASSSSAASSSPVASSSSAAASSSASSASSASAVSAGSSSSSAATSASSSTSAAATASSSTSAAAPASSSASSATTASSSSSAAATAVSSSSTAASAGQSSSASSSSTAAVSVTSSPSSSSAVVVASSSPSSPTSSPTSSQVPSASSSSSSTAAPTPVSSSSTASPPPAVSSSSSAVASSSAIVPVLSSSTAGAPTNVNGASHVHSAVFAVSLTVLAVLAALL